MLTNNAHTVTHRFTFSISVYNQYLYIITVQQFDVFMI